MKSTACSVPPFFVINRNASLSENRPRYSSCSLRAWEMGNINHNDVIKKKCNKNNNEGSPTNTLSPPLSIIIIISDSLTGNSSQTSFQPVSHDWCNKGRGMCYTVCGMMHIKEPLLLIGKSSQCGGSGFPLSLSEWFITICLTPYNRK